MSDKSFKHLSIKIYGQVQGINFRSYTREKAQSLDIRGFVTNEPDSSVLIEAEGQSEKLDKFLEWCGKGPLHAEVETVKIEEKDIVGYENFGIR